MTKVELFEHIRRDYHIHGKSRRRIARDRGIHRRVVRQALESSVPPPRQAVERLRIVLTDALRAVVDGWLKEDRKAPRKQRHTARQIFKRLQNEHDYAGAESTVRGYVGERRRQLGLGGEVHVVQFHQPGEEAEVDWYEAVVRIGGVRIDAQIFQMRACCSGREFHMAFPRQTQQAFLEGFVAGFEYFGVVFATVRLDNLSAEAKKILRGRRREETEKLIALRSHYLFETEFCRPGKEGAHEKGGVECGVGRFRRTHLVPVPEMASFAKLNDYLLSCCAQDDARTMEGREQTIAESWGEEIGRLRPLPAERFDTAEVQQPRVDDKSRVRTHQNWYSVPVRLAQRRVEVRVYANRIEVFHAGARVAEHERLQGRFGQSLELDHYLELLQQKPGALRRSLALRQVRDRQRWPACFDAFWELLQQGLDEPGEAAAEMVELLLLCREEETDEVIAAVELAVECGVRSTNAIKVLLRQLRDTARPFDKLTALGKLERYERPADADLSVYDLLVAGQAWVRV